MIATRPMTRADLDTVLGWAADEGWNPGLDDAAPFLATDPEGFFLTEVDGRPAAAISVVNHSADMAFLGLYLCRPEFRRRGIGLALWTHALAHAGDRTVGLDGVPAQQDNYRRSGFVLTGETSRFAGPVPPREGPSLRPAGAADLPALLALAAWADGHPKDRFNAAWFTDTATRRTLVLDGDQGPAGLVTVRRCVAGFKIGPLVARDPADAPALLHGVAPVTGDAEVMIDLPAEAAALSDHCRGLGMTVPFSTARMYRGPAPRPGAAERAVATLELG